MPKDRSGQLGDLLSAYLDDELDEVSRAEVTALLLRDPTVARLLGELRETQTMLKSLPRERAPADFEQEVLAAVERSQLLGEETQPATRVVSRRSLRPLQAAAAVVLLIGGAGLLIFWQVDRNEQRQLADLGRLRSESARSSGETPVGPSSTPAPGQAGSAAEPLASASRTKSGESGMLKGPSASKSGSEESPASKESAETGMRQDRMALFGEVVPPDSNSALQVQKQVADSSSARLESERLAEELLQADLAGDRLELTLNFADESTLEQYSRQFDADLVNRGYLNVEDPIHRAQIVDPLVQNVFAQSIKPRDASQPAERQYVVSAPPDLIESMVDRLTTAAPSAPAPDTVETRVGGVKALGVENARTLVRGVVARKYAETMPAPPQPPVLLQQEAIAGAIQQGPPAPETEAAGKEDPESGSLHQSLNALAIAKIRTTDEDNTAKDGSSSGQPVEADVMEPAPEKQVLRDSQSETQRDSRAKLMQRKQASNNAILLLTLKAVQRDDTPATQPAGGSPPPSGGQHH